MNKIDSRTRELVTTSTRTRALYSLYTWLTDIQYKLPENEKKLRDGIKKIGLNVMNSESPVIPILLANRDITCKFAKQRHEEGVLVECSH